MKNKVAVIGAGPSGIMCSIFASKNNDVTLFCQDEKIGKKILVTGNGRCNLANIKVNNNSYNVDISTYLKRFDSKMQLNYFKSIGLETYSDNEGRVYPLSNSAVSVLDILTRQVTNKNINSKLSTEVEDIIIKEDGFDVVYNNISEHFDKVVIATGTFNEFKFLDKLHINPYYNSLVALKTKQDTHRLNGVKLSNVKVTLTVNNKQYFENGEVLFKDKGLSGICIFNLSSYLARNKNYKSIINIDLMPWLSLEETVFMLKNRLKINCEDSYEFMQGLFHKEVNNLIIKNCKLNDKIQEKDLLNIAKNIKNMQFDIVGTYDNFQVKSGGISLNELTLNLEHKVYKNLYFAGEVCDVDGLCGGYNLMWAFASGKIVGDNL